MSTTSTETEVNNYCFVYRYTRQVEYSAKFNDFFPSATKAKWEAILFFSFCSEGNSTCYSPPS